MKSNFSLSSRAELLPANVPAHLLIIVLFSFFEPWIAPNSELFSYLTSLIIDTFKYIVQLIHPLWGVAALFCGVANLSMSFEFNGAPLSDSRRPRVDPTSAILVGASALYRLSFQPWVFRCACDPTHHQPGFSVLRQLCRI